MVLLTMVTIPAGILRIQFFPEVEGDVVSANLEMPEGTPASRTQEVAERIRLAGERVVAELQQFEGVFQIKTDRDPGLTEIQLGLKPAADALGLTLDDLARQARSAFFGEEALRVQRGREDVRVYVRLPESERDAIADVEELRTRSPQGGQVPLSSVAQVSFGRSPTAIQRKDGQRILWVTARVNPEIVSGPEVNQVLRAEILPRLAAEDFRLS